MQIEAWMTTQGIVQVFGLPQFFLKTDEKGLPVLILAKVVDDLIIAGKPEEIQAFHAAVSKRFKVGRFLTDGTLIFNRLYIEQRADGSIKADMREFLDKIKPLEISRSRRREQRERCTESEVRSFLALTGALNYLGLGIMPQAAFIASHLQQSVSRLTVAHLCTANKCLEEIKSLHPEILYATPEQFDNPSYLAFSDASQGKTSYGQTGYVSGIYIPSKHKPQSIFHMIDWLSQKQSRVSFSAIGAEILAAATSADRGSMMAERITLAMSRKTPLPFILTVDSHGLYSTITTLHDGQDYRLRPTVSRMRDSFENEEITVIQWIPGVLNFADALTKRNLQMFRDLIKVARDGTIDCGIFKSAKRARFDSPQ